MKVALVSEGTYPFVHGGVSVWCDQLIRGLPDFDFDLYAIADPGASNALWTLPANVSALHRIDLSERLRERRISRRARTDFLAAYSRFIDELVARPQTENQRFLRSLQSLYEACRAVPADEVIMSEEGLEIIRAAWLGETGDPRIQALGPPSLSDMLEVSGALARLLRPFSVIPDADVIHATANGLSALVAMAGTWAHGTPVVLTEHGVYLRERYLAVRDAEASFLVDALLLRFFRHVNTAALQVADLVTPVSDYNRRWELQTGAEEQKVRTTYNGVDPARFPETTEEPTVPTVTWVGRIDPLKDVQNLIRSFGRVRDVLPSARLKMFGSVPVGNEPYFQACKSLIEELGLGESATFEGHTSVVSDAHRAGHVVALSSISEGFPYTVIEAMMSGRATVSTDVGGVGEAVGDTGLLVPPRDPEQFGTALITLLDDDQLRRDMGKRARRRALQLFTLDRLTDTYRDIYTRLGGPTRLARELPVRQRRPHEAAMRRDAASAS